MRRAGESRNIPAAILGAVFGTAIALLVCMAFAHILNPEKYDTANRVILYFIVATTFIVPIAGGIEGGLRDGARGAVGGSLMFFASTRCVGWSSASSTSCWPSSAST